MPNTKADYQLLTRLISDETAAREYLESLRWPDGPVCPHCGCSEAYRLVAKKVSARPARAGLLKCKSCRKQFTVKVGTIFEDSNLPLNKWLFAISLMTSSKKGISAHQLHRTLGVTYRTAWHVCHRIRKAMEREPLAGLLTGIVEADETFVGGKKRGAQGPHDGKAIVMAVVERDGQARSQVVEDVKADTLQGFIVDEVDPSADIMTDGLLSYKGLEKSFASHSSVNHDEHYVVGQVHTNTAESLFSLLKRGILGTFHHVSAKHLQRYASEFDFRWNRRDVKDSERMRAAIQAAPGKRLKYRQLVAGLPA
ncbi:MAG TPA: IS1595 family transposase [Thermoanaerobaculia bacterium]|nr:IS1595 family transposase [Thermoanaerobaculia bacterium]